MPSCWTMFKIQRFHCVFCCAHACVWYVFTHDFCAELSEDESRDFCAMDVLAERSFLRLSVSSMNDDKCSFTNGRFRMALALLQAETWEQMWIVDYKVCGTCMYASATLLPSPLPSPQLKNPHQQTKKNSPQHKKNKQTKLYTLNAIRTQCQWRN